MNSGLRAFFVTYLFLTVGLWWALFHAPAGPTTLPHLIFYAVLTLNTYFSVRFHASFTPESPFQTCIDLALAVSYIALAVSIGAPIAFSFCAVLIFAIAPAKYTHTIGRTPHDKTLRKKVLIDLLGTVGCVLVLGLTFAGFELQAAWILAGTFTLANMYLLFIRPMYVHVI